MIEGWRSVVQAQAAYKRVIAAVECFHARDSRACSCRAPEGRVDRRPAAVSFRRASRSRSLNGVSFDLEPGHVARHRRAVRAPASRRSRKHARRLPAADGGQRAPRRNRAAQLGPPAVRHVHRLPAAGGRAVPRHHQGECLPHAQRSARREGLRGGGRRRRARHDLPAAARLRDRAAGRRRAAVGRPEAAHRASPARCSAIRR